MPARAVVTVLRLTAARTVPLRRRHHARLGLEGAAALEAYLEHVETPGLFRATWDGRLTMSRLSVSRLVDGMPVRFVATPFAVAAPFPKPPSPSPYDELRQPNVATLLTSPRGDELYESCSAALVGWNGSALVLPPLERPRVDSLAEGAVASSEAIVRAPLSKDGPWPLLLINAVAQCEPAWAGRAPFPLDVRARLSALLEQEDA